MICLPCPSGTTIELRVKSLLAQSLLICWDATRGVARRVTDAPNSCVQVDLEILTLLPNFFKMTQNLDLRCVLVQARWVLGPKQVSNPE